MICINCSIYDLSLMFNLLIVFEPMPIYGYIFVKENFQKHFSYSPSDLWLTKIQKCKNIVLFDFLHNNPIYSRVH